MGQLTSQDTKLCSQCRIKNTSHVGSHRRHIDNACARLGDSNKDVRVQAIRTLAGAAVAGPADHVDCFPGFVKEPPPLREVDGQAFAGLLTCLEDVDEHVRSSASKALAQVA